MHHRDGKSAKEDARAFPLSPIPPSLQRPLWNLNCQWLSRWMMRWMKNRRAAKLRSEPFKGYKGNRPQPRRFTASLFINAHEIIRETRIFVIILV
eukprot:1142947-Pelagomonas_calceolata.AAC.5